MNLLLKLLRFLILVESGKEDAFNGIAEARSFVITAGRTLDQDATRELLRKHSIDDDFFETMVRDKKISDFELWSIIKEKVSFNQHQERFEVATQRGSADPSPARARPSTMSPRYGLSFSSNEVIISCLKESGCLERLVQQGSSGNH